MDHGLDPTQLSERSRSTDLMPTFDLQNGVSKLEQILESIPAITVFHSQSDPDGYWCLFVTMKEDFTGWNALRILTGALIPNIPAPNNFRISVEAQQSAIHVETRLVCRRRSMNDRGYRGVSSTLTVVLMDQHPASDSTSDQG